MFSQNSSVQRQRQHNRVLLSPIKKSKKRKLLESRQKNFVLDCTNETKSKVEEYNYIKDKFLNYCVVKVPKRKRIVASSGSKSFENKENLVVKDHINFKNFLESKREEILAQSNLSKTIKFKQPNTERKERNQKVQESQNQTKQICENNLA